ncbi:MAG: hypothetical protein WKG00_03375 [Polyangiaceae bacterium]
MLGKARVRARTAALKRLADADARIERLMANPALRALDAEQRVAMRDLRASLRDLQSSSFFPPPGPEDDTP